MPKSAEELIPGTSSPGTTTIDQQVQELLDSFVNELRPNVLITVANRIVRDDDLLDKLYPMVIRTIYLLEKNNLGDNAIALFEILAKKKSPNFWGSDTRILSAIAAMKFSGENHQNSDDARHLLVDLINDKTNKFLRSLNSALFLDHNTNEIYLDSINELWHAKWITEVYKYKQNATNFTISECDSQEAVEYLAENLITPQLEGIYISKSKIDATGVKKIADALASNTKVKSLSLTGGKIGIEGAQRIAILLTAKKSLKEINLMEQSIGDPGTQAIATAITSSCLTSLVLSRNNIEKAGAESLFASFIHNSTLKILDLSQNKIHGIRKYIALALQNNKPLEILNLSDNDLDAEDAKVIAEGLEKNDALIHLMLNKNKIQNSGTEAIANALAKNKKLSDLDLMENKIEDEGAKYIANALKNNNSLQLLRLSDKIGKQVINDIFNSVISNKKRVTPLECRLFTENQNARIEAKAKRNAARGGYDDTGQDIITTF